MTPRPSTEGIDNREPLASLRTYSTADEAEARDLEAMCELAAKGDPFNRSSSFHLTASALVVDARTQRVLLRWHARHQRWMQVGGHGDPGESDPFAIALREATEETGLRDLVSFPSTSRPGPVQVGVVDVGANAVESAHRHGDIRYLMATASPELIVPESDDTPLRWCTPEEAFDLVDEENLRVLFRRTAVLLAATGE